MSYECPKCHRFFTGLTTFDRHQDVDYKRPHGDMVRCQDPVGLGMVRNERGAWGSGQRNTFFPSLRAAVAGTGGPGVGKRVGS